MDQTPPCEKYSVSCGLIMESPFLATQVVIVSSSENDIQSENNFLSTSPL